jgi:lipopolysaccharide transport system ATP-binding protein
MQDISRRHGRTVILVSHNIALIQSLSTTVLYIKDGEILALGNPRTVTQSYLRQQTEIPTSAVDTTDHPNRLQGMQRVIRRVQVADADGQPAREFLQGAPITVVVDYDGRSAATALCGLGIIIDAASSGARVASLATYFNQIPPFRLPTSGTVKFQMREPRLNPGRYHLSICVSQPQYSLIDSIEPAITIDVLPSDIYATGYILSPEDGVVAASGELELIPG